MAEQEGEGGVVGAGMERVGPVTQDDPVVTGWNDLPDRGSEGDLTFVAVFEDIVGAQSCAEDLRRRGLGLEAITLARRGDGPEQGLQPGNVITGPGYGLSAEGQSPPRDEPMGTPVAVGATLGATTGLLAATHLIPGLVFGAGSLIATLAGAGIGTFVGGLWEVGARDPQDDASLYAGQVRHGGVLLLVRASMAEAGQVRDAISFWQPLELRMQ